MTTSSQQPHEFDMPVTRITHPHDFIDVIPHLIGVVPRDSVVLCSLRTGPEGAPTTIGLMARIDIEQFNESTARVCIQRFVDSGASQLMVVAYSEVAAFTDNDIVTDLLGVCVESDVLLDHLFFVVDDHVEHLADIDGQLQQHCPRYSVQSMTPSEARLELIRAGSAPLADSSVLLEPFGVRHNRLDEVVARSGTHQMLHTCAQLIDSADRDIPRSIVSDLVGHLVSDTNIRDAVIAMSTLGSDVLTELSSDGEVGIHTIERAEHQRSSSTYFESWLTVMQALTAVAPLSTHAVLATVIASGYRLRGAGVQASVLCDYALMCDRDYRLAVLLRHTLDAGIMPKWMQRAAQSPFRSA